MPRAQHFGRPSFSGAHPYLHSPECHASLNIAPSAPCLPHHCPGPVGIIASLGIEEKDLEGQKKFYKSSDNENWVPAQLH